MAVVARQYPRRRYGGAVGPRIREIAQVHKRLETIKTEIEELANGELSHLMKQVEEAATDGRDLLAEIAVQVDARIEQRRAQLKTISKPGHAHGR